jgi:hypothetical protein
MMWPGILDGSPDAATHKLFNIKRPQNALILSVASNSSAGSMSTPENGNLGLEILGGAPILSMPAHEASETAAPQWYIPSNRRPAFM